MAAILRLFAELSEITMNEKIECPFVDEHQLYLRYTTPFIMPSVANVFFAKEYYLAGLVIVAFTISSAFGKRGAFLWQKQYSFRHFYIFSLIAHALILVAFLSGFERSIIIGFFLAAYLSIVANKEIQSISDKEFKDCGR